MNAPQVLQSNKALPSLTKDKLPATPPQADPTSFASSPPQLPPKFIPEQDSSIRSNGLRPPPIDIALSNESLGQDLDTPGAASSPDSRAKRSNPLVDLIETEKLYVDQLTGVIRKVAAAWSRSNLPPHDLDLMFRSIESIYKADRSLLSRLKEIGTNPSSPKALGDLLMRWIGELETPYTSYCERFCTGFDEWEPVCNNTRLPDVLAAFSVTVPPPHTSPTNPDSQLWTLDELFLLPMGRLKYFKKLYGRLLKATQPGRNDYKVLAGAGEKLDRLLAILDARANIRAGSSTSAAPEVEDEVVVDLRSTSRSPKMQEHPPLEVTPGSESSSTRGSSLSSAARSSNDTSLASVERGPTGDLSIPLSDLESRLAVERCTDIFTMKPRPVRLQIIPPSLSYARTLRVGMDMAVRFVPRSTGVEVNHPGARVFVLTDLFLLCEKMIPGERSTETPGADMWLLYPPLAGKHLKVARVDGEDCALQVTVLRKEKLVLVFSSTAVREKVLSDLNECIEFASAVHAASKQPVPPMPKLHGVSPRHPSDGIQSSQTAPELRQPSAPPMTSRSPSPHRVSSPIDGRSGPPSRNSHDAPPVSMSLTSSMSNLVHSLEAQIQQGGSWTQPAQGPRPTPPYPSRQSSHSDGWENSVGQPRFTGGPPLGPAPISQGPSFQAVAPDPRAGPLPDQMMGPGQYPPQRAASADPLGRRGPLGLVHSQQPQQPQPMHGMDTSSAQRGLPRLLPNPPNGQFAPPHPAPPRELLEPPVQGVLRKSPSTSAFNPQPELGHASPFARPGMASSPNLVLPRTNSLGSMGEPQLQPQPQPRLLPPSAQFRAPSVIGLADEPSPPTSPTTDIPIPTGPVTSTISAQMKCKVFLKQAHAQWKSLGSAKLKLYREQPTNVKQLVVEAEDKNKSVLISTIVLTDGVERVGKTGVAVELSDKGSRTGIIYMIQLRNEQACVGLYEGLLAGSDRTR